MKILIAPDKFKGSLGSLEVAENIAKGLRDALPNAGIDIVPMADGGEGTAEAICEARSGSWLKCKAHDPLGRQIDARYGWIEDEKLAVMEMSEAAGMRRLSEDEQDPVRTTTFGVGEMILDASRRGAKEIIIGLGGSATNDGGFGMARALGFRFFGQEQDKEEELKGAVSDLRKLTRVERPSPATMHGGNLVCGIYSPGAARPLPEGKDRGEGTSTDVIHRSLPKIIVAADVRNPLLGENGATRVFGPQKGATPDKVAILECSLARLADVVSKDLKIDYRDRPGAGAAGGLGFGLMSFCGAITKRGFNVVAQAVRLESRMKDADAVITGEGSLDRQTLEGKTPSGVARLARKMDKPVFAIVGRASQDPEVHEIFDSVYQNARPGMSEHENMAHAAELLRENARELGEMLNKRPGGRRPMSNIQWKKKKRRGAREQV
jgi:glycerate kinase